MRCSPQSHHAAIRPRTALPIGALAVAATMAAAALISPAGAAPASTSPPTLGVVTTGHAIRLAGTPSVGATAITFSTTNRSAGPSLIRLKPGVSANEFFRQLNRLKGPPDTLQRYGTFVSGAEIARGHARTLTIALTPATYVVADTDGKNPEKFTRTSFTAAPGPTTAALPTAPATITLKDFRFAAPTTIHRGLVRIVNAGHQLHFVDAIKVPHGMSAARVVRLLHEGHDAKVKLPSTGLLGLVSPGTVNLATIELARGTYVLACFYGSSGSRGKEHTMLGMERTIHVR